MLTLAFIIVFGVVCYIIDTKVEMYDVVKLLFRLFVVAVVVVSLLMWFGVAVPAPLSQLGFLLVR